MKFIDSISNLLAIPGERVLTEEEKEVRLKWIKNFVAKCKTAGVKIYLLDHDWYKK